MSSSLAVPEGTEHLNTTYDMVAKIDIPEDAGPIPAHLALQLQHPVEQSLGRRWASRYVDIDRYDAVASTNDRIGVVVVAATVGARTHGNNPPYTRS